MHVRSSQPVDLRSFRLKNKPPWNKHMKFVVFGAGAIGSILASRLIQGGQEVGLIARGAHLAAIQQRGLRVRSKVFGDMECRPHSTDNPAELGPVDAVLLTVKAHSVPAMVPSLAPLLGPDTALVTFQNGIPWWYFYSLGGEWEGTHLESVDPGRVIAGQVEVRRVIGALSYCTASRKKPGVVEHLSGARFPMGELDGSHNARIENIAEAFRISGMEPSIRSDIRSDVWVKLFGNVPFNPISALTRATFEEMLGFGPARELVRSIMEEVRNVAAAFGTKIPITAEQRISGATKIGAHKSSMLQDLEAGRPPELEPIVGSVVEMADKVEVEVPNLRAVYGCAKLLFERTAVKTSSAKP